MERPLQTQISATVISRMGSGRFLAPLDCVIPGTEKIGRLCRNAGGQRESPRTGSSQNYDLTSRKEKKKKLGKIGKESGDETANVCSNQKV